jgi:hypothetical protein
VAARRRQISGTLSRAKRRPQILTDHDIRVATDEVAEENPQAANHGRCSWLVHCALAANRIK